ncbi:Pilus assembly protein, PilP [Legionella massiliensis]|uniref:Pilus assembly protein, PilP n=2 Tax=Legionella massiliensis TaxID=1034943 RepID=A0A078L057_9GAMM|nr:Pilus assembly protein, PilP [Legionella massiliensis]CEE14390.1 Pilus assembly protein, PilP [Legionella massiliensis]
MCSQAYADSDIHTYIKEVKSRPRQLPEPIPYFEHLAKFSYSGRDSYPSPFQPRLQKDDSKNAASNRTTLQNSLKQTPLESLRFVGLMKTQSKTLALISYPGGELSGVVIGDFLGTNSGKIVEISENYLRVEESSLIAGKREKKLKDIYLIDAN